MKAKYGVISILLLFYFNVLADGFDVKMEELVVTPSKFEREIFKVPLKIDVIDKNKIEMSGASNLGEVIGKFMTGHFHKYNGGISQVGLRGFRTDGDDISSHVLVLIDGHRLGTGNLSKIPLDRIERIEIVKGPVSALYGSDAMGGVINIITKKEFNKDYFEISQKFGNFKYSQTGINSDVIISEKVKASINAGYEEIDNYKEPKFGEVYNSGEQKTSLGMNLLTDINDNQNLRIGGSYIYYDAEYPSWDNWTTYSEYSKDINDYSDKNNGYFDFEYNLGLTADYKQKIIAYYLKDRNYYYYGSPDTESTYDKYETTGYGLEFNNEWAVSDSHVIDFGLTYEMLDKETSSQRNGILEKPYLPGMEYDIWALYVQEGISIFDEKLKVVLGGRYDIFYEKTKASKTGEYISFTEKDETFEEFTPKVGLIFNSESNIFRLRANIGKGFKAPTAEQLSSEYEYFSWGTEYRFLGNQNLEPETSLTYDIGIDFSGEDYRIEVGYFHTDWKDKIQESSNSVFFKEKLWLTWENVGEAVIEGCELSVDIDLKMFSELIDGFNIAINALVNTKYEDKELNRDLFYISDYEVKSSLSYRKGKLRMALDHILVGPQKIQNWDGWLATVEKKDSFDFTDFKLDYKLSEKISFNMAIQNIFENTYEWVRGYIMPERNYKFGIKWIFGK